MRLLDGRASTRATIALPAYVAQRAGVDARLDYDLRPLPDQRLMLIAQEFVAQYDDLASGVYQDE